MTDKSLSDTIVDGRYQAPQSVLSGVDVGGLTHPGKVRSSNEDNFHIVQFGRYLRTVASSLRGGYVGEELDRPGYGFAVADGVGGHLAGEVASRLAITLLIRHALQTPDWILRPNEELIPVVMDRATERFRSVNENIVKLSQHFSGCRGMGTTLSLAVTIGTDLLVAHVGDSPIFLHRQDQLHRLTRDHTKSNSESTRDEAKARFRHVLTHAIGIPETGGQPDVEWYKLADGDRLLLCTDGLTNMVDEESIARELGQGATATAVCRSLIDLTLDRGARDNVTAVAAIYHTTTDSTAE